MDHQNAGSAELRRCRQTDERALPNLKERTELETLYTEGGYGCPNADQTLVDNRVEQIPKIGARSATPKIGTL
jgi:hypothetical protein